MHHVSCPCCGVALRVGQGMAGIKAQCNQCATVFIIPVAQLPVTPVQAPPPPAVRPGARFGDDYDELDVERPERGSSALAICLAVIGILVVLGVGAGAAYFLMAPVSTTVSGGGIVPPAAPTPAPVAVPVVKEAVNPVKVAGGDVNKLGKTTSTTYTVSLVGDPKGVKKEGFNNKFIYLQANSTITVRVTSDMASNINLYFDGPDNKQIAADNTVGANCYLQTTVYQTGNYSIMVDNLGPGDNRCHITYDITR